MMFSYISNRTMIATILICLFLLIISFAFNSCLMPTIRQSLLQRNLMANIELDSVTISTNNNHNSSSSSNIIITNNGNNLSDVLEIQLVDTIVRNVPLTGELNEIEIMPKYRLLSEHGEQLTRHLPGVLIIGVKKSGTRALLEFIRLHPDVRAAGCEVHFFDRHYNRGLHWYRNHMPPTINGQITMEKTPSYFITKEVPFRVHHMNPSTKLLVVVRDPVTRAISDYAQAASKRKEMKSFEELAFINQTIGAVDTKWGPIKIGLYARYLERWLQYFPLSQFLFISGERLIVDPAFEMGRVQDFLGLKRVVTEKFFYFNTSKGFPCLVKSEARSSPHCLGKSKGRNHPEVSPIAYEHLKQFYRPFNMKFYRMTGIDFGWS